MSGVEPFELRSPDLASRPGARIAIVGSGISGLVAARELHPHHEIALFEAAPRLGGHTHTVDARDADGRNHRIDLGFIVYNERTYPTLTRLFAELGVATEASEMSFSVRSDRADLEWNGSDLDRIFAQRRNLLRPSFYRMIAGILRFHRKAPALLHAPDDLSLGRYLETSPYPRPFVDLYLLPMLSAIWSTEPHRILDFPVRTMAAFLDNHGMLTVDDRPQWRVVSGGSSRYVEALVAPFEDRIRVATPVERIRRVAADGVSSHQRVELRIDGGWERFDAVVVAVHTDQALALLDDPTPAEREVLGAIPYQDNEVILHTDARIMPRRRKVWASWNYHLDEDLLGEDLTGEDLLGEDAIDRAAPVGGTRVTYWMNRLQNLPGPTDFFVTLNRGAALDPARVLERRTFAHPLFTTASLEAKRRWPEISGDRTVYCGASWGFGFHEDGAVSGLRAARVLAPDDAGEALEPARGLATATSRTVPADRSAAIGQSASVDATA